MENTRILFLYSKYSKACGDFIKKIKDTNISFFKYVNIDSKGSRKILKKMKIKQLPCIVVLYNETEKEVFEGEKAYAWFGNLTRSMEMEKRQEQQRVEQQRVEQQQRAESYQPPPEQVEAKRMRSTAKRQDNEGHTSLQDLGIDMNSPEVQANMHKVKKRQGLLKPDKTEIKNVMAEAKKMAQLREGSDKPMSAYAPNGGDRGGGDDVKTVSKKMDMSMGLLDEEEDIDYEYSESESE